MSSCKRILVTYQHVILILSSRYNKHDYQNFYAIFDDFLLYTHIFFLYYKISL